MEQLIELLIPAIVLILFILGKFFGSSDEEEPLPSRPPRSEDASDPQTDDRTRQIQEEIRRKIAERRAAQQGETSLAPPPPVPVQEASPPMARNVPPPVTEQPVFEEPAPRRGLSRYEDIGENRWDQFPQESTTISTPEPEAMSDPAAQLMTQIAAQRQRAEEARRRYEEARQARVSSEAKARYEESAATWGRVAAHTGESFAESIQRMLLHPNSTRQAFVLHEILGTPVGLRGADGSQRPKWEE
ncbi:MAG: hypothetical protein ACFBZ8_08135 [Opitutales bacterium]